MIDRFMFVLEVLEMIEDYTLHKEEYEHSYPYDWRTKQPVILRACKQWFVDTSKIKNKAMVNIPT